MGLSKVLKQSLRSVTRLAPGLQPGVQRLLAQARQQRRMLFFLGDAKAVSRYMRWHRSDSSQAALEAQLFFQYHKIEKGLCMPGTPRFFGAEPVAATAALIQRWKAAGLGLQAPALQGARHALQAYRERLQLTPPPEPLRQRLLQHIEQALGDAGAPDERLTTPVPLHAPLPQAVAVFDQLMLARRSVRSYKPEPVPQALLEAAIATAQLSPSACNRQPCRVHVYTGRAQIDAMLRYQNGNSGFGHLAPVLLVVTADMRCFFDASERNQPFVDGGLFAMSLVLALQSQGICSCCLNWCVDAVNDKGAHDTGQIEPWEKIIMYLAVGYATEGVMVPRSARRSTDDVVVRHPALP